MTGELVVGVESGAAERVSTEMLIAPFFSEDRPLRGVAGRVDWRMCGLISELLKKDQPIMGQGDALLVGTNGQLASHRVLLLDVGRRDYCTERHLVKACAEGIRRTLRISVFNMIYVVEDHSECLPDLVVPDLALAAAEVVAEADARVRLDFLVTSQHSGAARSALSAAISIGISERLKIELGSP